MGKELHMQRPSGKKTRNVTFGLLWVECRNLQRKKGKVAKAVHKGPELQAKMLG